MRVITNQLVELPQDVEEALEKTNSGLRSFSRSDFFDAKLFVPSTHLLRHPGKLIRPTMIFIGAKTIGERPAKFVDIAMSAELLHTSSLVHDDIIDKDSKRRGVDTVHKKYGREIAILAGDALISKAVELIARYGERVVSAMSRSAMTMCAGELLDYRYQRNREIPTLRKYLHVAELKSASIMSMCSSVVALYKDSDFTSRLEKFGVNFGLAFQIRDDIIDYMQLDSSNGSNGRFERFRPNVVTTLVEHDGLSKRQAITKAINLNNRYIDTAQEMLNGSPSFSVLKRYSEFVRVSAN